MLSAFQQLRGLLSQFQITGLLKGAVLQFQKFQ